jgi:hypothetical protein
MFYDRVGDQKNRTNLYSLSREFDIKRQSGDLSLKVGPNQ